MRIPHPLARPWTTNPYPELGDTPRHPVPGTFSACSVGLMNQKRRGGRPSKGDRADIKARIPTDKRDKLFEYAELVGRPVTDLTAEVLVPWIDSLDLEQLRHGDAQARLPVDERTTKTA